MRRPVPNRSRISRLSKAATTPQPDFQERMFECMPSAGKSHSKSRIHKSLASQNCWMSRPIGRLTVQNFRVQDRHSAGEHCDMQTRRLATCLRMARRTPAYVNPLRTRPPGPEFCPKTSARRQHPRYSKRSHVRSLLPRIRHLRRRTASTYTANILQAPPDESFL